MSTVGDCGATSWGGSPCLAANNAVRVDPHPSLPLYLSLEQARLRCRRMLAVCRMDAGGGGGASFARAASPRPTLCTSSPKPSPSPPDPVPLIQATAFTSSTATACDDGLCARSCTWRYCLPIPEPRSSTNGRRHNSCKTRPHLSFVRNRNRQRMRTVCLVVRSADVRGGVAQSVISPPCAQTACV